MPLTIWRITTKEMAIEGLDGFIDLNLIPAPRSGSLRDRPVQVAAVDGRDLDPVLILLLKQRFN